LRENAVQPSIGGFSLAVRVWRLRCFARRDVSALKALGSRKDAKSPRTAGLHRVNAEEGGRADVVRGGAIGWPGRLAATAKGGGRGSGARPGRQVRLAARHLVPADTTREPIPAPPWWMNRPASVEWVGTKRARSQWASWVSSARGGMRAASRWVPCPLQAGLSSAAGCRVR